MPKIIRREFNLKFSIDRLINIYLLLEKMITFYPEENDTAHKTCIDLMDNITKQLSEEERQNLVSLLNAIHLEKSIENGGETNEKN